MPELKIQYLARSILEKLKKKQEKQLPRADFAPLNHRSIPVEVLGYVPIKMLEFQFQLQKSINTKYHMCCVSDCDRNTYVVSILVTMLEHLLCKKHTLLTDVRII